MYTEALARKEMLMQEQSSCTNLILSKMQYMINVFY